MNPFRNIIRLSVGDFLAKTLNFVAFVYLARVLGVAGYGELEFARAILTYFLLLADGGLEIWATREAAQGKDLRELVSRVVPLRFLLAICSFGALLVLLPVFPDYPALRPLLALFGLTLLAQAVNLKWVFMGQEKMGGVALGVVLGQIVFAATVFAIVPGPAGILWVPLLLLASELAMAAYFLRLFTASHGGLRLGLSLRGSRQVLVPALTMGAGQGFGLVSFNFDSVLLGFLLGSTAVGWYNAAYKPVTVVLAMPVTYFFGLFPALSRAFSSNREEFQEIVNRSLRLTSILAVPVGVGGIFFAGPIISLLFGQAYSNSVPALQILSWSAGLVILRGTYRYGLNAAGRARLDLACAGVSTALNVGLNLLLIPRYGIVGAALATVAAEAFWLTAVSSCFFRYVMPVSLLTPLARPIVATVAMAAALWLAEPLFWVIRASIALSVYVGVLLLLARVRPAGV